MERAAKMTELRRSLARLESGRVPVVEVLPGLRLRRGRVHEVSGPSRAALAIRIACAMSGPVLWIAPRHHAQGINPDGIAQFAQAVGVRGSVVERILCVDADRAMEALWAMEEALRSGAVPLVVAECRGAPGLVAIRRLHLAAGESGQAPLGLLLCPGFEACPGVESRWHATPQHDESHNRWHIQCLRQRGGGEPAPTTFEMRAFL